MMNPSDHFQARMRVEEALEHFQSNVNLRETIFSTDHWLMPHLATLRHLLSDPITYDEAEALEDVLYGRRFMKDLIEWLRWKSISWTEFFPERERLHREALWAEWLQHCVDLHESESKEVCPGCGSRKIVPVLYGIPSAVTQEAARRGAVALGGCCLPDPPCAYRWLCKDCRHRWPGPDSTDD